jgi:DNA repair protein RecO (recombination protein O)
MLAVTEGLVLREVLYRDADKMLTILTKERGKVSASCPGARARQSTMRAGTQLLSYSNFTLYESRGRYSVNAAEPVELFLGLRNDILSLSLASYFAEVLDVISEEETPSAELLSTGLNCLYALSVHKKPRALIKAVFELRAMLVAGYMPDLSECAFCGEPEMDVPIFDVRNGRVFCARHRVEANGNAYDSFTAHDGSTADGSSRAKAGGLIALCPQSLQAMRYILSAEPKKMLSFSMDEEPLERLAAATERYLACQTDKAFSTLKFYQSL